MLGLYVTLYFVSPVVLSGPTYKIYNAWLRENVPGVYMSWEFLPNNLYNGEYDAITFKHEADALAFKLKFGHKLKA